MNVLVERVHSFRLPRWTVLWVVLGVCLAAVARSRLAAESATIASLDSAIAGVLATKEDQAGPSAARLLALVAQKRDAQIVAARLFHPWRFLYGGGVGVVCMTLLSTGLAVVIHLVRGPSRAAATTG